MGNISTILAAILCAAAPLASMEVKDPKTEMRQSADQLGSRTVSSILAAYQNGDYREFFSGMDASHKAADLSGLTQMREKEIPLQFQQEWEQRFTDLRMEKNRDLLGAISDSDDSLFAEKVRSVAANLTTPEQEKALSRLHSLLTMAPGTGANEDENRLIDIDIEYEYKILHAEIPSSDVSLQQQQEQQIALRMEKMDKMVEASKTFQDLSLKQAVGIAAATLDQRLARNLDGADLNALAKGKVKPSNETEEKVYSILSSYQGKFSDLMKELDHANR